MTIQVVIDQGINFTTIFLGIFIEAAPFLLLGTIASGLVEVFVGRDDLLHLIPHNVILATIVGALLGFVFPVCECGVVPLTRRLLNKGLPVSAGITFLLAAPIINPVVLASTFAAYGWSNILFARFVLGFVIAVTVGLIFSLNRQSADLMKWPLFVSNVSEMEDNLVIAPIALPIRARLQTALRIAGDEFFEMGRYLVIGALLAALMQTFIPQNVLKGLGALPVVSVGVMIFLAYMLSVCSTVDAFLSLTFVNTFATGSILAFLVFGAMVDIKSTFMFARVFKTRTVVYLVLLPMLLTALFAIFINLNLAW